MCYPKPGPRCSGHARQRYNTLRRVHADQPNHPAVLQARDDYDATPDGLAELGAKIVNEPSPAQRAGLEGRRNSAVHRRQRLLAAYRQTVRRPLTEADAEARADQEYVEVVKTDPVTVARIADRLSGDYSPATPAPVQQTDSASTGSTMQELARRLG